MSFSVICNFEASSDENLRMHIRKEHDDRVLSCEKCEGPNLRCTYELTWQLLVSTVERRSCTIAGRVTWNSVLVKRHTTVKIVLLCSTEKIIWKFMWTREVVQFSATSGHIYMAFLQYAFILSPQNATIRANITANIACEIWWVFKLQRKNINICIGGNFYDFFSYDTST